MAKLLYLFPIAIVLSACTGGGLVGERPVIYSDHSDAAYITVMRKSKWIGGGSNMTFGLDGKEFGKLANGEYITFAVSPKTHYINAYSRIKKIEAEPGGEYFIRMRMGDFFSLDTFLIETLSFEEGKAELQSGDYKQIKY